MSTSVFPSRSSPLRFRSDEAEKDNSTLPNPLSPRLVVNGNPSPRRGAPHIVPIPRPMRFSTAVNSPRMPTPKGLLSPGLKSPNPPMSPGMMSPNAMLSPPPMQSPYWTPSLPWLLDQKPSRPASKAGSVRSNTSIVSAHVRPGACESVRSISLGALSIDSENMRQLQRVDFQTTKEHHSFKIGDSSYVAFEDGEETLTRDGFETALVTLIPVSKYFLITRSWLREKLSRFLDSDDVFCIEFLQGIIFYGASKEDAIIESSAVEFLEDLGNQWMEWDDAKHLPSIVPGPCISFQGTLLKALKLYDDTSKTFVATLRPQAHDTFETLKVSGRTYDTSSVAIPSRIQYPISKRRPINGWRIGVKDCFQIAGLKMTLGNKAYGDYHPAATKTAACIERLVEAGAVIVGTTKLSSFMATEEPTQSIDYQTSWNPRADGYQSPAGSSSGSGAAVASYEWLDIAIGSDTSGSTRRPGHWNGCFALRPTWGLLPNEGFASTFAPFDTPTFLARDLVKARTFAEAWYGKDLPNTPPKFPTSIVYPTDYLPVKNLKQQKLIDDFIADLESALGFKHTKVSFQKLWNSNPPAEANGLKLEEFMKDVGKNTYWYDDFHAHDAFRKGYRELHKKNPYVGPAIRYQWEHASKITKATRDEGISRLSIYKSWFLSTVLKSASTNTIIILPIEDLSPRYRDEPPTGSDPLVPPTPTKGTGVLFESPASGSPELTIPIGQVPYLSKITGNKEYLPCAISLLAAPGSDLLLMDLARDVLEKSGRRTSVEVGKWMFGGPPKEDEDVEGESAEESTEGEDSGVEKGTAEEGGETTEEEQTEDEKSVEEEEGEEVEIKLDGDLRINMDVKK